MKLSRTPVFIDLDRPRRIVFNMHVRKQLEELQEAGVLDISKIFQQQGDERRLDWTQAMRFIHLALSEDGEQHGDYLTVDGIERLIESVPQAVAALSQVFDEYGRFLGVSPKGEAQPAGAAGSDAGSRKSGPQKKRSESSAAN